MFFGVSDDRVGSGGGWNLGTFINLRPSDNLSISLEPRFGSFRRATST
jgi:hypothetical protein